MASSASAGRRSQGRRPKDSPSECEAEDAASGVQSRRGCRMTFDSGHWVGTTVRAAWRPSTRVTPSPSPAPWPRGRPSGSVVLSPSGGLPRPSGPGSTPTSTGSTSPGPRSRRVARAAHRPAVAVRGPSSSSRPRSHGAGLVRRSWLRGAAGAGGAPTGGGAGAPDADHGARSRRHDARRRRRQAVARVPPRRSAGGPCPVAPRAPHRRLARGRGVRRDARGPATGAPAARHRQARPTRARGGAPSAPKG